MKIHSLLSAALLALMLSQGEASAQFGFPRMNRDSLDALTNADQANMMKQLGLTSLRPGRDGYSTDPAIGANYDEMIANPYLNYPDPLVNFDGRKVKNAKMWFNVRRPELIKVFEDEFYGHIPANVPGVKWQVVSEERKMVGSTPCISRQLAGVVDNSSYPAIEVTIQAEIVWPENAPKNIPVIMEFGFIMGNMPMRMPMGPNAGPQRKPWTEQVVERGWAACTINPTSFQTDGAHGLRQGIIGLCNKGEYRKPTDWGTLRAWGWGASKLVDYFESEPQFDATKVAVEGNSRYGKTALVAAVFDDRIAASFPSSAGKAGTAPWRRFCGETVENIAASSEYHWMCGNFLKYASDPYSAADMPVDQHELVAICAPRPVLVSSGTFSADKWQDLIGMHMTARMASPVYDLVCDGGLRGDTPEIRTDIFPGMNVGLMGGRLAFRMHDGGHEPGPNWPYFLDMFDKYVVKGQK
ncbi:MAG: acetylxylan esterase [Bacteroidales bacterium]|nr:acetylxylan esterase [Bacteroidales bacterium]